MFGVGLPTTQYPSLMNLQRSIPTIDNKGVRPHTLNVLPAMEEVTVCPSSSASNLSDSIDCNSSSNSCVAASSSSSSSITDESSLKKERRTYRIEYLRCKRLRAKGYRVPMPAKSWQMTEQRTTSVAVPMTEAAAEVELSKDELRRIKNRESAERSRRAVNDAIEEAERCLNIARQQHHVLQAERAFLLQQMTQVVSHHHHQPIFVASAPSEPVFVEEFLSFSNRTEVDSEANSVISDALSDLTPDDVSQPQDMDFLHFDMELTDEDFDALLANV